MPLLSILESTLARHSHSMTLNKEARTLKVVRVKLDDGRRVIGIRYPLPLISEIASMLSMLKRGKKVHKEPRSTYINIQCDHQYYQFSFYSSLIS